MTYKKLVRDKIPEIIRNKGGLPVIRTLDDEEYKQELLKKLVEEANELLESKGDMGERADVAEVLLAIDQSFKLKSEEIESTRRTKTLERGGFSDKIYLEKVD